MSNNSSAPSAHSAQIQEQPPKISPFSATAINAAIESGVRATKRCCATTNKGTRCKKDSDLHWIKSNGAVLCRSHRAIFANSDAKEKTPFFANFDLYISKDKNMAVAK